MGLIDDKRSITTQIGVFNSIGKKIEIPDQNDTLSSIDNKNEAIPFMLDLLTQMKGSQGLSTLTGEVVTKFVRKAEPAMKATMLQQSTSFNSDKALSTTSFGGSGYDINMKDLDLYSKLKVDPSSQAGSMLYGDNANSFDQAVYNAINAPGTDILHNNIKINYNKNEDKVNIKPQNPAITIGAFFGLFIGGMTLLNEKEFTAKVIESIFGVFSINYKKSKKKHIEETKISKLIDKISNDDENLEFTEEEEAEMEKFAQEKYEGSRKVDVGCSILDSDITLDDVETLINDNLATSDPISVGRNFESLIDKSFGKKPEQVNPKNKNAIKDGFFKRVINTIKNMLIEAVTSTPQARALLIIIKGIKNDDILDIKSPLEDIKAQKNLIKCLGEQAKKSLTEFIFNLLKTELIKLLIPVLKVVLKEKIQGYISIIKSLV